MDTTAHAVLRDRRAWLGTMRGLAVGRDGDLSLAGVPAPADGKALEWAVAYPCEREISGLACGPGGALFVADTAHHRLLYVDTRCGAQSWLPATGGSVLDAPGHFRSPRGLAVMPDALLVADSGHSAVHRMAFPGLEANFAWRAGGQPTSVAVDSQARTLAVDATARRVHRLSADGRADSSFDAMLDAQHMLQRPLCVAVGRGDCVLVSDAAANTVFAFDEQGRFLRSLNPGAAWLPGAIAADTQRCYVADAGSGAILVFDDTGVQGQVSGWRGPVTALALNDNRDLFIKPGMDARCYRFAADAAFATTGELLAGPFDAGEERVWERAWIDAEIPSTTRIDADVALESTAAGPLQWVALPGGDALLAPLAPVRGAARFVWLRLRLHASSPQASPLLKQARVATAAEDYLAYLPLTYRAHDGADGFLSRWLRLVRGEFDRIEEAIDDMPRVADPQFAPGTALQWLAQWLAMELPEIESDQERRALIERAVPLLARRGTVQSIADFAELNTGVRPAIVEAFAERCVWMLGTRSRLDFDTRLPPFDPQGMVVPDAAAKDCCPGAIGAAVVGEAGPLAEYQIGLPLFSDAAYRFCVVVDSERVRKAGLLDELCRIVEREKPAHTDFRVEVVAPVFLVGLQARVGIDAIVGSDTVRRGLDASQLDVDSRLAPFDGSRVGDATLDGSIALD